MVSCEMVRASWRGEVDGVVECGRVGAERPCLWDDLGTVETLT